MLQHKSRYCFRNNFVNTLSLYGCVNHVQTKFVLSRNIHYHTKHQLLSYLSTFLVNPFSLDRLITKYCLKLNCLYLFSNYDLQEQVLIASGSTSSMLGYIKQLISSLYILSKHLKIQALNHGLFKMFSAIFSYINCLLKVRMKFSNRE